MGGEAPKPPVDCKLAKNKKKAECKQQSSQLSDEQLYYSGYWLARAGKFAEALSYLTRAQNQNDPRILNYIGYSTRKLGDVEGAIAFYHKALAADPNYTVARAYLGEAFLQLQDIAQAKGELAEIEKRCGTTCAEFAELKGQIAAFEARGGKT
jgi:tetratricopeptide (TPR) repeat protein